MKRFQVDPSDIVYFFTFTSGRNAAPGSDTDSPLTNSRTAGRQAEQPAASHELPVLDHLSS